jgi:hypothetical protein
MGEPGFETLHLVTQPLFIRKLRLNINDSEMQYFLAMAIQSGSIDVGSYLRNSHTSYAGNTISALAFFNLLRSGQGNYAPNWPVELLENPNLFDFVGNDPLDGIDLFGEQHWWNTAWDWLKEVGQDLLTGLHPGTEVAGTLVNGLNCAADAGNLAKQVAPIEKFYRSGGDLDFLPPTAGGK